jgi:hypothetical protein
MTYTIEKFQSLLKSIKNNLFDCFTDVGQCIIFNNFISALCQHVDINPADYLIVKTVPAMLESDKQEMNALLRTILSSYIDMLLGIVESTEGRTLIMNFKNDILEFTKE